MSDSVSVNSQEKPIIRKRPDGLDPGRYKKPEKWSNQKWAWEFLRRNEKFQAECKRVKNGTSEEKAAVAAVFGLRRFKYYREPYVKAGKFSRPQFQNGAITSWSHTNSDSNDTRSLQVRLNPGQVLIRFDVAAALESGIFLDRQLEKAAQRLQSQLKKIRAELEKTEKSKRPQHKTFGQYLRMLDARAAGKTVEQSGEIVSPTRVKERGRGNAAATDVTSQLSKKMKTAIEHSEVVYLYLAGMKSKTNAKSIPLQT